MYKSVEHVKQFLLQQTEKENRTLVLRFNEQIKIAILILSIIKMERKKLNEYIIKIVNLFFSCEFIQDSMGALRQVIIRKGDELELSTWIECFKLSLANSRNNNALPIELPYFIKQKFPDFIIQDQIIEAKLNQIILGKRNTGTAYELLVSLWKVSSDTLKGKIKEFIADRLNSKFDSTLYFIASYEEIIDYKSNLDKFIDCIPRPARAKEARRSVFGYDDPRNETLDEFLLLAFKFSIPLKEERFQKLHEDVPYYKWLLNLDTFDYKEFNVYWILYNFRPLFLNEFKKREQIKAALKASFETRPIKRLKDIYIKHFTG